MMDVLLQIIQPYISDPNTLRILVVVLAGMTFAALSVGMGYLVLSALDPVRRRLGNVSAAAAGDPGVSVKGMLLNVETFIGPVAQYVLPQDELERNKVQRKLTHAGFRQANSLQICYAVKTVLAIGLPVLVFFGSQFFPEASGTTLLMCAFGASGLGLFAPNLVLGHLVTKRLKRLRDGFPDALDLLVVCVEAGLGLAQAIQRVADELIVSHPELAAELSLVNAEVRAGVDRVAALKNLSARSGLDDIKGLVSLLTQTLRFGTSIADTLRVYSDEFRDKRMQRAEEQAAKMGTKMIFPLIFFMFPAFFVVAVGPSVIRLMTAFSQMGGN
jgi:tight adherence protein C